MQPQHTLETVLRDDPLLASSDDRAQLNALLDRAQARRQYAWHHAAARM